MILLKCCGNCPPTPKTVLTSFQTLADSMPCLIKGLFVLIGIIVLIKYLSPIIMLCIKNWHENHLKTESFEQEMFWKYIQLSQIDKDAEIKKLAEAMAKDMASDKFNDRLKELDVTLKQKELDWYKKFTEETKDKK